MTEAEWQTCNDIAEGLNFILVTACERKRRLFACGCCRDIWDLLTDHRSRYAVEVVEQFADGKATAEQIRDAFKAALAAEFEVYQADAVATASNLPLHYPVHRSWERVIDVSAATRAAAEASGSPASWEVNLVASRAVRARGFRASPGLFAGNCPPDFQKRQAAERKQTSAQVTLLHDIFVNPFRPITFSPDWRTDIVVSLARQMYEARDFSSMPILADALQDGGCDSADILDHCRGPGPHVRGCWVVDLVLGNA